MSIQWAHQKRNYEQTLNHTSQEKIYFLDVRLKTNVFIDKIYVLEVTYTKFSGSNIANSALPKIFRKEDPF